MSWEHMSCPKCSARMVLVSADYDKTGRAKAHFCCRECGTEADLPEPDDNYQSRMELAAKEGQA